MDAKNFKYLILFNILGALLFLSWLVPENHGFWFNIDKNIFYFFNNMLTESKAFMYFVSFINLRGFDIIAFIGMLIIFYDYFSKKDLQGKRFLFCVGITMLLTAILVKQVLAFFPIDRTSPTIFFKETMHLPVNLISELSGWNTKCRSSDCFPGDHGIMLLIFSSYMWRYCNFEAFKKCLIVFIIFSLPRIMGGAHWFTDVVVGSTSTNLLLTSWILLTPASDKVVSWLEKTLPLGWINKYCK